jgi:protein XRP2
VYCFDAIDSMQIDECEDCTIVVAACEGSIFIRDCKRVKLIVACKQLRTRDCVDLDVNLFAMTDPVIEMSHNVSIRPFNAECPNGLEKFKKAKLDPKCNRFPHIYDFTADVKLGDQNKGLKHFEVFYPNHGLQMVQYGKGQGTPSAPPEIADLLAGKLQPAASSEEGGNKSFNIKTASQVWNQDFEADGSAKAAAPAGGVKSPSAAVAAAKAAEAAPKPAAAAAPQPKPAAKAAEEKKPESPPKPAAKAAAPAPAPKAAAPVTLTKTKPVGALARDDDYSSYEDSDSGSMPSGSAASDSDDGF